MKGSFEKIAIIGSGCILPGCHTPKGLAEIVMGKTVAISSAPEKLLARKHRKNGCLRSRGFDARSDAN